MNNAPFISVIICTLNGEDYISKCLDALTTQDYPKSKYEVIVIDDGSTDRTPEIVKRYDVKLVRHTTNLGIPSARNSGIKHASGEIVAFTDDDCVPKKNWLSELVKPYADEHVIGVGGYTLPLSTKTITERYMADSGYGNPAPIEFAKNKNPLYRFIIYIKDMLNPVTRKDGIVRVQDIYTLNASFRKTALDKVHGFDEKLHTSEDVDICARLNKQHPGKILVFTNKAIILHKNRTSFMKYLKQTFSRSENTLLYYLKSKKVPPIFPFPLLIITATLLVCALDFKLILWTAIILPQLLYVWWFVRLIRTHEWSYILFPYIQLSLELATIIGMLNGYLKNKRV